LHFPGALFPPSFAGPLAASVLPLSFRTQVRDHPLHIDPHQAGLAHAPHAALRQREEAGPVAANELAFALPG
jgi:hypothetical protein